MSRRPIHDLSRREKESSPQPRAARAQDPGKDLAARLESAGLPPQAAAAGNSAIGRMLEPGVRTQMEQAFGEDFSGVRVEKDAAGPDALQAAAFTSGEKIHVGAEAPSPESPQGQRLLAHELAHVVQQRRAQGRREGGVSRTGDRFEAEADRAAGAAVAGGRVQISAGGATPAVQRQPKKEAEGAAKAAPESIVETAVRAWLNREWEAQSQGKRSFRITPAVRKGLELVFSQTPTGMASVEWALMVEPRNPAELMERIRGSLPKSVDPRIIEAINKLPAPKSKEEKIEAPELKKTDEAATAVLKESVRRLLETRVGQELAQNTKRFLLSKKGIPVIAIFVGGVVTYVAVNDADIPSLPSIDLGDGVSLQIEIKGRPSDLPPLLRQMWEGRRPPAPEEPGVAAMRGGGAAAEEVKVGITITGNTEQIGDFVRSVGRFFAAVGRGIAAGVVTVGEAIWPELLATAAGAGVGALIGGAVGGLLGAGIGALIGAGVGLIGALATRLVRWLTKKRK